LEAKQVKNLRKLLGCGAIAIVAAVILFVTGTVPLPSQEDVSSFSNWASARWESVQTWAEDWGLPQFWTVFTVLIGALSTVFSKVRSLLKRGFWFLLSPWKWSEEDLAERELRRDDCEQVLARRRADLALQQKLLEDLGEALKNARAEVVRCEAVVEKAKTALQEQEGFAQKAQAELKALHDAALQQLQQNQANSRNLQEQFLTSVTDKRRNALTATEGDLTKANEALVGKGQELQAANTKVKAGKRLVEALEAKLAKLA